MCNRPPVRSRPRASWMSLVAAAALALPSLAVVADDCVPEWTPRYGGAPGANAGVTAFTTFDEGDGPMLFVGGGFTAMMGLPLAHLARWNGTTWSDVGGGTNGMVWASTVFDDGSGPALYVAGSFTAAGGIPANRIARWDGVAWSTVGDGLNGDVLALVAFDDGTGPALYAGGLFTTAGGVAASRIARWDGRAWSPLTSGIAGPLSNTSVRALEVYDDGSGPALYVGGKFTTAGGLPASGVARWSGAEWSDVGGSLDGGAGAHVYALRAVDDDGGEAALYIGGNFIGVGGISAYRIARWDGSAWSPGTAGPTNGWISAIEVFDDGSGPALHVGGFFTLFGGVGAKALVRRTHDGDRVSWTAIGDGLVATDPSVSALGTHDDGHGLRLFVGGTFYRAGEVAAHRVVSTDGKSWSALGDRIGLGGHHQSTVFDVVEFDDGSGPALFAGGMFTSAGGVNAQGIAKWDEETGAWVSVGGGVNGLVRALAVFDDGSGDGPVLYVAGFFTMAGGVPASNIARWAGPDRGWSALRDGLSGTATTMLAFDDGSGPALYVGGTFIGADGMYVNHIARWKWTPEGGEWSSLGSGVDAPINDLTIFDDGSGAGPRLYAGGVFTHAGGVPATRVARWDGAAWSSLGADPNSVVSAMTVFDDGDGPALFVTGAFNTIGGIPNVGVGRWDGTSWTAIGPAFGSPRRAIAFFDDGSGPALHVGGSFTSVGGEPMPRLSRWNGSDWEVVDPLLNHLVITLVVTDRDDGSSVLHVGGEFSRSSSTDSFLLRRQGCPIVPPPIPGDLDGNGVVDAADLAALLGAWGPCPRAVEGGCAADLNGDGVVDGADLGILLSNWSSGD